MLINVVAPTGLGSPRSYFNLDWITLLVMAVIAAVGAAAESPSPSPRSSASPSPEPKQQPSPARTPDEPSHRY
jgi:hypothetical protein